jgi:hypothetical protein
LITNPGPSVSVLPPLPRKAIAVPPVPVMVPESKILMAPEFAVRMPMVPEMVPVLAISPAKPAPPVKTATPVTLIPIELIPIEFFDEIVPLLVMPPKKVASATRIAVWSPRVELIVPLLVMPPPKTELAREMVV